MPIKNAKRILLKLSGEVLMGEQEFGIDPAFVLELAQEVKQAKDEGWEICLVIGGGWTVRRRITWACWPR